MFSSTEVAATRAGMMNGGRADCLESTSSIGTNGSFSVQVMVLSSVAVRLAVLSMMIWPPASFLAQRSSEATASAAVTGAPSWNLSPSRRVKV